MKKIIIQDRLFELFPEFRREVVIVCSITNRPSYKRIRKLLKKEIERRADIDLDSEPRLASWDEALKKFGSRPGRYLPSIKSLLKRT